MDVDSASSTPRGICSRSKTRPSRTRRRTRRMMRKVLITGGAGFIGSHVADEFLGNGWDVTIVDDLSSGKRENLPAKATFHEIGVNSQEFSKLAGTGGFHVVAHLA